MSKPSKNYIMTRAINHSQAIFCEAIKPQILIENLLLSKVSTAYYNHTHSKLVSHVNMPNTSSQGQGQSKKAKKPLKCETYPNPNGKFLSTYLPAYVPNPSGYVDRPFVETSELEKQAKSQK